MTIHDDGCPACHAPAKHVQPYGATVQERQWHVCHVCATPVLLTKAGEIVRVGKA